MEVLKIKKLNPNAHIPTRAHDTDAGMDLYALPVEYTDEEKEKYKATISMNATYSKFFDIFGEALFGEEGKDAANTAKIAADVMDNAKDSDWDELFGTNIIIPAHGTKMIPTGIAVSIDPGYVGYIFARSGLATKKSLAPINAVGVIDSSYRGEIKVPLHNHSDRNRIIDVGDRIAQLVIQPISLCTPVEVDELDETDRGVGGFGSSGQK